MKKIALITGGTRGIGAAIADNLKNDYTVLTVGRSKQADIVGDLLDKNFREHLITEYTPDIFINNAVSLYQDPYKMLEMVGYVPVELLLKFYEKMQHGIIINISSLSAEVHVRPKEHLARTSYSLGKRYLKDVSLSLNYSKNKPVKVMCISPALTHTDLLETIDPKPSDLDYENFDFEKSIAWTRPEELANIIRMMIDLPPHIVIPEMVLDNHYSKSMCW